MPKDPSADRYPLSEFPYYEINDWNDHQPSQADGGKFIRNWTGLLGLTKYTWLSGHDRGVLHGLWLYRGLYGMNPPRDPHELRTRLSLGRDKYLTKTLQRLEKAGWIKPSRKKRPLQRRGKEIREEKNSEDTPTSHPTGRSAAQTVKERSIPGPEPDPTWRPPITNDAEWEAERSRQLDLLRASIGGKYPE